MGIPKFFKNFLKERDKTELKGLKIVQKFKPNNVVSFSMDLNSTIHEMAGKVYRYNYVVTDFKTKDKDQMIERQRLIDALASKPENLPLMNLDDKSLAEVFHMYVKSEGIRPETLENELFDMITDRIYELCRASIRAIQPKYLVIAVDGLVPMAKIVQQRKRRYGNIGSYRELFDSNCITPGTEFMKRLDAHLARFLKNATQLGVEKVIYSGYKVEGEGEHKIMEIFRSREIETHGNHIIYGLDSDLIVLTMMAGLENAWVMRSEYEYISVNVLRDWLARKYSLKSVNDFAIITFLVGNDFLPKIPQFYVLEKSLHALLYAYQKIGKPLETKKKEVDFKVIDQMLKIVADLDLSEVDSEWGAVEKWKFVEDVDDVEGVDVEEDVEEDMEEDITEVDVVDVDIIDEPIRGKWVKDTSPGFVPNTLLNNAIYAQYKTPEPVFELVKTGRDIDDLWTRKNIEFNPDDSILDIVSSFPKVLNLNDRVNDMVNQFIRGVIWCYNYYTGKNTDKYWFYNYHYAPTLAKVMDVISLGVNLTFAPKPSGNISIREQILCVIPPHSEKLIPEEYRKWLVYDKTKRLALLEWLYPRVYTMSTDGMIDYEHIVFVPFPDIQFILDVTGGIPEMKYIGNKDIFKPVFDKKKLIEQFENRKLLDKGIDFTGLQIAPPAVAPEKETKDLYEIDRDYMREFIKTNKLTFNYQGLSIWKPSTIQGGKPTGKKPFGKPKGKPFTNQGGKSGVKPKGV
jgi:5'-3' exonuclease